MELHDQCRLFSALPRSGGILDQDSFEIKAMQQAQFYEWLSGFTKTKAMKELSKEHRRMRDELERKAKR